MPRWAPTSRSCSTRPSASARARPSICATSARSTTRPTFSSATHTSTAAARSTSPSPSARTPRRWPSSSASRQPCRACREVAQAVGPDVQIDFEFDQSPYVVNAIRGLIGEGLLGALLTGLMVLLFLRDWRSALIVVATIPFALLARGHLALDHGPDHQHHDAGRPGAGGGRPGGRGHRGDREHPHPHRGRAWPGPAPWSRPRAGRPSRACSACSASWRSSCRRSS